ncbi:hypothetical protein K0M31_020248 [Melipona bicolor]|uniref:Uncharacterized protein n=1 Tax=Melipona bicolor TaxID=60889 RepID=A0AA40KQK0_9HYME|nr:hypothetical protein K0M31_020248 [Melipona bicolor]
MFTERESETGNKRNKGSAVEYGQWYMATSTGIDNCIWPRAEEKRKGNGQGCKERERTHEY